MPPVMEAGDTAAIKTIEESVKNNEVVIFSKQTCPFCTKIKTFFQEMGVGAKVLELDQMGEEGVQIQVSLKKMTGQATVPNVFVNGKHIGGCNETLQEARTGNLAKLLKSKSQLSTDGGPDLPKTDFEYDLIVIGGGSGGLAASKEAAKFGLKVAVFDYVRPTPKGTTWGLGGTCVNVGCIPKKLMHQAALIGESLKDSREFGWQLNPGENGFGHEWTAMVENIQNHIRGLNWGYKAALRSNNVKYLNEQATFVGPNVLEATDKKGDKKRYSAKQFILATGGRPKYPEVPGAVEFGITSDDIFSLPHAPGKTLVVGASYIALETAGFLRALNYEVDVMVRSILLRGFDQQIAEKIGEYMASESGINFIRPCVPVELSQVQPGSPGLIRVKAKYVDEEGTPFEGEYNTVIFAVGREAETTKLGLDLVGVDLSPKDKKCLVDEAERTNVPHVFAIGDIIHGKPELTPVAIQAGKLLARRIVGTSTVLTDYVNVPTTVFTPIEYGSCGYSEEEAIAMFGEENLDIYHQNFWPLEWTVPHRPENSCYAKLICQKSGNNRVVGLHYLGPNAGEVTQGFSGMMRLKATKQDFDDLIGIHPTCAEIFTTMNIIKGSGEDPSATGC